MRFLLLLFVIALSSVAKAQKPEWTPIHTSDGVTISFKYADCKFNAGYDEQWIVLKLENNNSEDVTVTWNAHMHLSTGHCVGCDNNQESEANMDVVANSSIEGICSREKNQYMHLFVKFIEPGVKTNAELEDFDIANFTVTKH